MNRGFIGALSLSVALALLAGCGGSQPPIGKPGTTPQTSSAVRQAAQHGESGSGDLMYVASDGKSYILTYPEGKLVGTINEGAVDACSDSAGNAYLTTSNGVDEFSHGATTPSTTFAVDGASVGCAIDPMTGDLAVTYYSESGAFIAIFSPGNGQPKVYSANNLLSFCGYDNQGNLFANYSTNNGMGLVELPSGGNQLLAVSVSPSIPEFPGRIQWDGKYLTIESGNGRKRAKGLITVKRVTVSGSTATVVGTTAFAGIKRQAQVSWIFNDSIILPFGNKGESTPNLGYWKYPKGGKRITSIKHPAGGRLQLNAVTVSEAS